MSRLAAAKQFQFISGNLSLDFCNTVGGKRGAVERNYLDSLLQYIAWCYQAGILSEKQADAMLTRAEREPLEAAQVLQRAINLREAIFRIFGPCCANPAPAEADLGLLNFELSNSLCRLRLVPTAGKDGFEWKWVFEGDSLDQTLGPIAHSAATLLTNPDQLGRLRTCQGDQCGWLFIDASRNHSRCWCDMRDCGNRAKMRRHRARHASHRTAST